MEITSRYDGRVAKLHYKPGDTAKVGSPLVDIATEDGDSLLPPPASPAASATPTPVNPQSPSIPSSPPSSPSSLSHEHHLTLATPAVRRIAKENKVDLSKVNPTGKGGRITKEDVILYLEALSSPTSVASSTIAGTRQTLLQSCSTITFNLVHNFSSVGVFNRKSFIIADPKSHGEKYASIFENSAFWVFGRFKYHGVEKNSSLYQPNAPATTAR